MKTLLKTLLLAVLGLALSTALRAQLKTYQTLLPFPEGYENESGGYASSVSSFNGGSRATQGELFTNVLAISGMTYNLFTTGSPIAAQLRAEFGRWDTNTSAFVGDTLDFGTLTNPLSIPTIAGWSYVEIDGEEIPTFSLEFDVTAANGGILYETNPSHTYALMLTQITGFGMAANSGGNLRFGIGRTDSEEDFGYGTGAFVSSTGAYTEAHQDFTFSQIVVIPNPTIPESSTVVALLGSALVLTMVTYRIRQRRQAAPVAGTAAA